MINAPLNFYKELARIFENHEIINWEAKDFWNKLALEEHPNAVKFRRIMYSNLRALLREKYLMIDQTKSKKNRLSYSQTEHLIEFKQKLKAKRIKNAFDEKKVQLLLDVKEKRNNMFFLLHLIDEDNNLEKYLSKFSDDLIQEIDAINSNIKLMEMILNQPL